MSEHFFGLGRHRVASDIAERIDVVARRHGAEFTSVKMPDGWRFWFACPNRGFPFDRDIELAVIESLTAEGLWPIPEAE